MQKKNWSILPVSRKAKGVAIATFLLFLWFWFSLPAPLFNDPYSTVLYASKGELLGAKIATDGQWRFPEIDTVPDKFQQAIIAFEDKRFNGHFGVDLIAIARAIKQNVHAGRTVSGGSTLTMQVMRLQRKGKQRTAFQKIIEIIQSIRLEITFSKDEILKLYTSHAPFGGNVVGLEAASWRYFGKNPDQLSWSEAATLAVLPNSPSLIHPGKNRDALLHKRNRLLEKLKTQHIIDSLTFQSALEEPVPGSPKPLPMSAPHFLEWLSMNEMKGKAFYTTINSKIQKQVNQIAERHHQILKNNEVYNLAVLVIDNEKDEVVAYVGNAKGTGAENSEYVNIINAPRSTGSILKPLLFSLMLEEGKILPNSLLTDVPIFLKDFRPENYSNTYEGAVSASEALSKSLNIPFVKMLQEYGVEKFHGKLKKLGLTTLSRPPDHYGLSLILGGAETTLWDITNVYASMAQRLNSYHHNSGQYDENDFHKANYELDKARNNWPNKRPKVKTGYLMASSIWLTFEAMKNLNRPNELGNWQQFFSQKEIAWKTGTSHGFKDAWAIGLNPKYTIGVWVGNADGEGRPGLIGINAAAPLLFEIFEKLPNSSWFDQPFDEMEKKEVCQVSGNLAKAGCPIDTIWGIASVELARVCRNHQLIYLDATGQWQVNRHCTDSLTAAYWFSLPPVEEHYYKPFHPDYTLPPPFHPNCTSVLAANNKIELIYPMSNAQIFVPIGLAGSSEKAVFKAVHSSADGVIHWHIDNEYLQTTKEFHHIEVAPKKGKHVLILIDQFGNRVEQKFEVVSE